MTKRKPYHIIVMVLGAIIISSIFLPWLITVNESRVTGEQSGVQLLTREMTAIDRRGRRTDVDLEKRLSESDQDTGNDPIFIIACILGGIALIAGGALSFSRYQLGHRISIVAGLLLLAVMLGSYGTGFLMENKLQDVKDDITEHIPKENLVFRAQLAQTTTYRHAGFWTATILSFVAAFLAFIAFSEERARLAIAQQDDLYEGEDWKDI